MKFGWLTIGGGITGSVLFGAVMNEPVSGAILGLLLMWMIENEDKK